MLAGTEEHRAFMRPKFPVAFELFYSVFEGTVDDVRARLEAGDDPNARSVDGRTPIFSAVRLSRDLPKADLLLAAGARIDVWDSFGMQPIHWVTISTYDWNVDSLIWLLERGADANSAIRSGIEKFDPIGWTPLHIASDGACLSAIQLLLRHGADANRVAADGSTALHIAAGKYRVYKSLIRALVDAGANMNAIDAEGSTALHILARGSGRYRKSAIKFLRHRGADITVVDSNGRRPLDLVMEGLPAIEAIRRLLSHEVHLHGGD